MDANKIITLCGGTRRIADALGITLAGVRVWRATGKIPPRHALAIEKLSRGKVKARAVLAG